MKKRKKIIFIIIISIIVIFFGSIFFLYFWGKSNLNTFVLLEYGQPLKWSDLLNKDLDVTTKDNIDDLKEVGEYQITLHYLFFSYPIKIQIKDTTSPEVEVQDVTIYFGEPLPTSEDFIVSIIEEASYVVADITFENVVGTFTNNLIIKDEFGNETTKEIHLTILENEIPTINGLTELTITIGDKVNLKSKVTAKDKNGNYVSYRVNDSSVNYKKAGTYKIYYIVKDSRGVDISFERIIQIKDKSLNVPPNTFIIPNFPTINQFPEYPNGCESAALFTLLNYYGVNV